MKGSYLGIDAHSTTGLELVAVGASDGEVLWRDRCPLKRPRLLEAVGRAPRPCRVVLEQGELATWLHMVLEGSCHRLIVADPTHNRLIATSPYKADTFDARTLARLAMGRYVKEVYQPPASFAQLRLLVRHQRRLGCRVVAIKNQIKALYRVHGLTPRGSGVYGAARDAWQRRLPRVAQPLVSDHYAELDVSVDRLEATKRRIHSAVRDSSPALRLCSIPQIGPLTAATFVAYVVTPDRFGARNKLWSYCGYGLMKRSSGSSCEPVRLRKDRNRHLKYVLKSAVVRICNDPNHPLAPSYHARRARGVAEHNAKLTIGRRLINLMAALWQNQQEFDPTKVIIA